MCGCGRKLKIQLQQHQMQKRLQVKNLAGGPIMRKPAVPIQNKPVNQRFMTPRQFRNMNSFKLLNGKLPGSNQLKNRPL